MGKVLKVIGTVLFTLAIVLMIIGHIVTFSRNPKFNPFNFSNVIMMLVCIVPGAVLWRLGDYLHKKSERSERVIANQPANKYSRKEPESSTDVMNKVITLDGVSDTILNHIISSTVKNTVDAEKVLWLGNYLIEKYPHIADGYDLKHRAFEMKGITDYDILKPLAETAFNLETGDIMRPIYYCSYLTAIVSYCPNNDRMFKEYEIMKNQYPEYFAKLNSFESGYIEMMFQLRKDAGDVYSFRKV